MSIISVVSGISIMMSIGMPVVSIIPSSGISIGIAFLYTDNCFFLRGSSRGSSNGWGIGHSIDSRSGCNSMGTGDKLSTFVLADIRGSIDNRGNMVGVNGGGGGGLVDTSVDRWWAIERGSHMMVEGVCINHRCNGICSSLLLGMRNGK